MAEIGFILRHEVLDLAVHIATEEFETQDDLVHVQLADEAAVEGVRGVALVIFRIGKLIVLLSGYEVDQAVEVGAQLHD